MTNTTPSQPELFKTATCPTGTSGTCYTVPQDLNTQLFQAEIGPLFIFGCAIFAVAWGSMAAVFIRNINMDVDSEGGKKVIEEVTKDQAQKKETGFYARNPKEADKEKLTGEDVLANIKKCGEHITNGAKAFLNQEYIFLTIWSLLFAVVLACTVDNLETKNPIAPTTFPYTGVSYLTGSLTSIMAGYIGMRIAVFTNSRVTFQCVRDVNDGFITAFRGGQVLGFCLVGLALLNLIIIVLIYKTTFWDVYATNFAAAHATGSITFQSSTHQLWKTVATGVVDEAGLAQLKYQFTTLTRRMMELVAGYGLGGSSVALFGRVGGGIYTKAADVGADLVGKTLKDLREDDINNPGTIADNVGDNVGDIAGMGSDLFGSLAESTCAALVVSSTSFEIVQTTDALFFPLCVTSSGVIASFLSVLLVHVGTTTVANVQRRLIFQIAASTILMTFTVIPTVYILPEKFKFVGGATGSGGLETDRWTCFGCIMFGLWSGMIIGFITDYYTNNRWGPTLELARACEKGPAPNIILGIALGYMSCIIPILCITATIGFAFAGAGMYGIGLSALGMLGSLPVALSVDGYGPISDNAGGIAEMSGLPGEIRDITDALDAAGNTTAAVGKGFAIGSACLVGLALFGAFITRIEDDSVDILKPTQFAGLLIGAMLPYAFSALTMKAVGDAAYDMMDFIIMDYNRVETNKEAGKSGKDIEPNYQGCIEISTKASLQKMVAPGVLVIGSPLAAGFLFGPQATAGVLAGTIVSGVQVAISASNTGGAWDNAKKEVEKNRSNFKEQLDNRKKSEKAMLDTYNQAVDEKKFTNPSQDTLKAERKMTLEQRFDSWDDVRIGYELANIKEMHVAAVVGDTVGDPLKDTSGPAINILVKLSAITSLVFGSYLKNYHVWGKQATASSSN